MNITNHIRGKNVMLKNFSIPCMTIVGKLKISPHFSIIDGVLLQFMPFCY